MTALAYAAPVLALIGVTAWALSVRAGHDQPVRYAVTRARWAWLCRKPPARTEGKLSRAEHLAFTGLVESWRQPAYGEEPERTRT